MDRLLLRIVVFTQTTWWGRARVWVCWMLKGTSSSRRATQIVTKKAVMKSNNSVNKTTKWPFFIKISSRSSLISTIRFMRCAHPSPRNKDLSRSQGRLWRLSSSTLKACRSAPHRSNRCTFSPYPLRKPSHPSSSSQSRKTTTWWQLLSSRTLEIELNSTRIRPIRTKTARDWASGQVVSSSKKSFRSNSRRMTRLNICWLRSYSSSSRAQLTS